MSRITKIVVNTDTISTTNITGLRASVRGLSLRKASLIAVTIIPLEMPGTVFCRPSRISEDVVVAAESMEVPSVRCASEHLEMLDDRPERERGEVDQPAGNSDHANEQCHVEPVVGRERTGRCRDELL